MSLPPGYGTGTFNMIQALFSLAMLAYVSKYSFLIGCLVLRRDWTPHATLIPSKFSSEFQILTKWKQKLHFNQKISYSRSPHRLLSPRNLFWGYYQFIYPRHEIPAQKWGSSRGIDIVISFRETFLHWKNGSARSPPRLRLATVVFLCRAWETLRCTRGVQNWGESRIEAVQVEELGVVLFCPAPSSHIPVANMPI